MTQTLEQDSKTPQQTKNFFDTLTQDKPCELLLKIHKLENTMSRTKAPNLTEIKKQADMRYSWVHKLSNELSPELLQRKEESNSVRLTLTDRGEETVRLLRQLEQTLGGEQK